jgi:hypothetical protein
MTNTVARLWPSRSNTSTQYNPAQSLSSTRRTCDMQIPSRDEAVRLFLVSVPESQTEIEAGSSKAALPAFGLAGRGREGEDQTDGLPGTYSMTSLVIILV